MARSLCWRTGLLPLLALCLLPPCPLPCSPPPLSLAWASQGPSRRAMEPRRSLAGPTKPIPGAHTQPSSEPSARVLVGYQKPITGDAAPGGCTHTVQGQLLQFASCASLDSAGDFLLAWTPGANSSSGATQVFFQGKPEKANGWAGWGVSPDGGMPGSDAVVGFGSSSGNAGPGANLYHMDGRSPRVVPLDQSSNGKLVLDPTSLQVELLEGGTTVQLLVRALNLDTAGPLNVIWRGGPSADAASGQLSFHSNTDRVSAQINFASAGAGGTVPPGPSSGASTPTQTVKIAHASLAASGFGVLLPLGILVARHLKLWADPLWFHLHIALQVTGYLVGAAGWALGVWLKTQFGDITDATQQAHFGIGIAVFCTATLQILTPAVKPEKGVPVRLYWNLVHWGLGYSTVILAFVNIFLGFQILSAQSIDYGAWRTVYIVWLSVWGALLLLLEPVSWYFYLNKAPQQTGKPLTPPN